MFKSQQQAMWLFHTCINKTEDQPANGGREGGGGLTAVCVLQFQGLTKHMEIPQFPILQ